MLLLLLACTGKPPVDSAVDSAHDSDPGPTGPPTAGEVSTLTSALAGADGIALTDHDTILVSQPSINFVQELSLQGVASPYVRDLNEPYGISLDAQGRLYIANWGTQQVLRAGSDGVTEVFAEMDDDVGNVWVKPDTQDVYLPSFNTGLLEKVDAQGARSEVSTGQQNDGLHAVMFDDQGRLYTGYVWTGEIYRHDAQGVGTLLATLPGELGNLLWVDGVLIASSWGARRLYTVSEDGEVAVFAGSGQLGSLDGDALEARFESPNGLAWDPEGGWLYVAESTGSVRRIELRYED